MNKKFLSVLLILVLALSMALPVFGAPAEVVIQILHTNDQHGRVLEGKYDGMGFAKLKTQIDVLKAENPNTLVLDAGDTVHGQTIATLDKGESVIRFMNLMGYDFMTMGNHDFNYGYERGMELAKMADFKVLAANVYKEDKRLFEAYGIKEVGGVKVGVFGLATPETLYKTHPDNVKGLTFKDPVAEAKEMVSELKGKVDVIICLAHIGLDEESAVTSKMIAEKNPEIDVIIDGHSHTELPEGLMVNGVLIASAKEYNKNLGIVNITLKEGKVSAKTAKLFTKEMAKDLKEDEGLKKAIDEVKAAQAKILEKVVGKAPWNLNGERAIVRTGESDLGSLIADAMLYESKADVSFTNGGGIRSSIAKGEITKGDVITVLPFGNYIVTKEMKGKDLLAALAFGVDSYPEEAGKFPHVGNICFQFDPMKEKGKQIEEVMIKGEKLDLEKTYVVATNDFIAAGGDGYTMFKGLPVKGEFAALDEALIQYLGSFELKDDKNLLNRVTVKEVKEEPKKEEPKKEEPKKQVKETQYQVKLGDVLWKIAKKFGMTWEALAEYNQLKNPHFILEGQILKIPLK